MLINNEQICVLLDALFQAAPETTDYQAYIHFQNAFEHAALIDKSEQFLEHCQTYLTMAKKPLPLPALTAYHYLSSFVFFHRSRPDYSYAQSFIAANCEAGHVPSYHLYSELIYAQKIALVNNGHLSQEMLTTYFQTEFKARLEWAANRGFPQAMFDLSVMLEEGIRVPCDQPAALSWRIQAAEQGLTAAIFNHGIYLQEKSQNATDSELAASWLLKAAQLGRPDAMVGYALICQQHKDTIDWLTKAAHLRFSHGMCCLAVMLVEDHDDPHHQSQAKKWYHRAAQKNHLPAKLGLAEMLYIAGDTLGAKRWYRSAAKQGDPVAMYNYAILVSQEPGAESNKQAEKWYYRAAKKGHVVAMYHLGLLNGTKPLAADKLKAIPWLCQAIAQGHTDAKTALKSILETDHSPDKDDFCLKLKSTLRRLLPEYFHVIWHPGHPRAAHQLVQSVLRNPYIVRCDYDPEVPSKLRDKLEKHMNKNIALKEAISQALHIITLLQAVKLNELSSLLATVDLDALFDHLIYGLQQAHKGINLSLYEQLCAGLIQYQFLEHPAVLLEKIAHLDFFLQAKIYFALANADLFESIAPLNDDNRLRALAYAYVGYYYAAAAGHTQLITDLEALFIQLFKNQASYTANITINSDTDLPYSQACALADAIAKIEPPLSWISNCNLTDRSSLQALSRLHTQAPSLPRYHDPVARIALRDAKIAELERELAHMKQPYPQTLTPSKPLPLQARRASFAGSTTPFWHFHQAVGAEANTSHYHAPLQQKQ